MLGWAAWRERWPSPANFYAFAFVLVVTVDFFETHAAAQHLATHRRDGVFEVLFTTPLQPAQIVEGEIEGLATQFRPLRRTLYAVFMVMILGGLFTRAWTLSALFTYFVIWGFLILWVLTDRRWQLPTIMWVALNSGRSTFAMTRSRGMNWAWAVHVFNLNNVIKALGTRQLAFPTGSNVELAFVLIGGLFFTVIIATRRRSPAELQDRLIAEMRDIVQQPVPSPKDPRFKNWNFKGTLP